MVAALAATLLLVSACIYYGDDIALLPSGSSWRPLPLRRWILNDGLGPVTIVYCDRSSCAAPSVAATFEAHGDTARQLELALADPRSLLKAKRYEVQVARDPRLKTKPKETERKSSEAAEPLEADGLKGYRVALTPKIDGGHPAYAVVLMKRGPDSVVKAALGVSADPDLALQGAKAAAKTF
jgi:hypothetical protein